MGCTDSKPKNGMSREKGSKEEDMKKSEKAMKSAILIQKWYRRYRARLEARERCVWNIFQSLEYQGEQDQLSLQNFFHDLIGHLETDGGDGENPALARAFAERSRLGDEEEEEALLERSNPADVSVEASYKGPRLTFPLDPQQFKTLVEAFKRREQLHIHYALQLLHEARRVLKAKENVNRVSLAITKQVTVCGDLHGQLDDLFIIFHKNGLPSSDNPYVFNGDFVDRGPCSLEVLLILLAAVVTYPHEVFLNRGNHEDHNMNYRYGFIKEITLKYKEHTKGLLELIYDVFSWLPLATVISEKILVCHGGISDQTSIEKLSRIDRHQYLSVLQPSHVRRNALNMFEWRQVLDLLWSDPKNKYGCFQNTFRGGGCYFGPDVTNSVLKKHGFDLLIRSHECKAEGYEYMHDNKVLTIFSASNYYEVGSNRGAYVKILGETLDLQLVQWLASKSYQGRKLTMVQRVTLVEQSALKDLKNKMFECKSQLLQEFKLHDPEDTGEIEQGAWCAAVDKVVSLNVPWRILRPRLVKSSPSGQLLYMSTFEEMRVQHKASNQEVSSTPNALLEREDVLIQLMNLSITETLYQNRTALETIFRIMDKDNSGFLSMAEFEEACQLMAQHNKRQINMKDVQDIARTIDINKDGMIEFNEFLEAFRIVGKGDASSPEGAKSPTEPPAKPVLSNQLSTMSIRTVKSPVQPLHAQPLPKTDETI